MGIYRSPAVALMPDVTPKPLRSKANAIINLMGAVGGIIYLGVTALLYPASKTDGVAHVNYQPLFIIVSVIMPAQVITPVLAGTLMKKIDYRVLFPYAALFVALSFVTMLFVRHGDSKAKAKRGLEAFEDMDD